MKKILASILTVLTVCLLVGCGNTEAYDSENDITVKVFYADLAEIPGCGGELYYSVNTHTVYYLLFGGNSRPMAPYIKNGHFCEYIDGEIVEVIPTVKIEDTAS